MMAEMARWAHQLQAKTPQKRSRIGIGVRVTEVQSRSHFGLGAFWIVCEGTLATGVQV